MRGAVVIAASGLVAATACGSSHSSGAKNASSPSRTPSPVQLAQQVIRFGQTGHASDTSGNSWRIAVSRPLLVAPWQRNPDLGHHIVVYRVTVANISGTEDVSGTDFEERVKNFTQNDLWSGGGDEKDLQQFMAVHHFRPQPPEAGSEVTTSNASATRTYYVEIRFSGNLSQVEFRPFGADDSYPAQLIWR